MTAMPLALGILAMHGASSIIPPQVVQSQRYSACAAQGTAPERLRIRVERVTRKIGWCPRGRRGRRVWQSAHLSVTARVLAVDRSAVGLVRGRVIHFAYRILRLCPGRVGPSNRPEPLGLAKGDVVWAFLRRLGPSGSHFGLAASFLSLVRKRPRIRSAARWRRACRIRYPRP